MQCSIVVLVLAQPTVLGMDIAEHPCNHASTGALDPAPLSLSAGTHVSNSEMPPRDGPHSRWTLSWSGITRAVQP